MADAWVLLKYSREPDGLVLGIYSTGDRAKEVAQKHAGEPLAWRDLTITLGSGAFIGWVAGAGTVNTIYEAHRFEVDAE